MTMMLVRITYMHAPSCDLSLEITVHSSLPQGNRVGTSQMTYDCCVASSNSEVSQ